MTIQWNPIETLNQEAYMGQRLLVECECGWWGTARLTIYGWRKDDGTVLPSPVAWWTDKDV